MVVFELEKAIPRFTIVTELLIVLLFLSACTFVIPIAVNPTLDHPPSVARVPLVVGLYYSSDFRSKEHTEIVGGVPHVRPIGGASVKLFDKVLPLLFESVVPVSSRPPLEKEVPKLAAVIEPKIEGFDLGPPNPYGTGVPPSMWAEIIYRVIIYSGEGEVIANWTITGVAERQTPGFRNVFERGPAPDQAPTAFAMEDALIKFMTRFRQIPEVQQWLKRRVL